MQGRGQKHQQQVHVHQPEERVGQLLHLLPRGRGHLPLHEGEGGHAEHDEQHEQHDRQNEGAHDVAPDLAAAEKARHVALQVHGHVPEREEPRHDGQLAAHGLQPVIGAAAPVQASDEHDDHEQGQRQLALLDEDEQRAPNGARQTEEHAVHVDDVDGDGGSVERDRKRLQGVAQGEAADDGDCKDDREVHVTSPLAPRGAARARRR